ncbi:hypothetical protein HYW76_01495 [Candidatus Pacearchaeota archaeon]|nr:hypothetical protein [Candidatus Pacearchaeota archaeon]
MQNIENFLIPETRVFIHGTPVRNINAILEGERFWGHYFVIDDKDRECGMKRFYSNLIGSVYTSLAYSKSPIHYEQGRFYVDSDPALIVIAGREEDITDSSEALVNMDRGTILSDSTFRVVHDPVVKKGSKTIVFPVIFGMEYMNQLSGRFQKYGDKFEDDNTENTGKLVWAYEQITRCAIRRINRRLKIR